MTDISKLVSQIGALLDRREYGVARGYAERALASNPTDPNVLVIVAPVLCETGEVDRGISTLEKALEMCQEEFDQPQLKMDILHNLKVAYIRKGDETRAKEYFRQLRELEQFEAFKADLMARYAPSTIKLADYTEIFRRVFTGEDIARVLEEKMIR